MKLFKVCDDSLSIESVVEIVRKVWNAVEDKAQGPARAKLKRDIAQSVDRLKGRIEKTLKVSRPPVQERLLFDRTERGAMGDLPLLSRRAKKAQDSRKPVGVSMTKTSQITLCVNFPQRSGTGPSVSSVSICQRSFRLTQRQLVIETPIT